MLGTTAAIFLLSATLSQVCHPFDQPSFAKMASAIEPAERSDMLKTWSAWSRSASGDVVPQGAHLSFRVQRDRSPSDPTYELRAWRIGNTWSMRARTGQANRKLQMKWSGWRDIPIDQARARKLSELVADDCLWTAPRYVSANVTGNTMFTEANLLIDVRTERRRWGGMQISAAVGRPAELASLALNWAFDLPPLAAGWPDR
jgi:hypothetical protein